jgi:hypothetical protein
MSIGRKIKRAFRGGVSLSAVIRETARHAGAKLQEQYERFTPAEASLRLTPGFSVLGAEKLLAHFRERNHPKFFGGFALPKEHLAQLQREHFAAEADQMLAAAREIVAEHRWPLLGLGAIDFGGEIDWLREPISGIRWPAEHHSKTKLIRGGGSDIRVLWELNRLGHLLTLGRAFASTGDEAFAEEFFGQLESWQMQNRTGYGPNWTCAMEVSLRAVNLIAAMQILLRARCFTGERLTNLLALLAQHGEYIRRHLEFSHLATSNHYLCDVAGLFWLGVMLPEFEPASEWREFGLRELLNEMDKQILPDGADYEAATGYHRLKSEIFLYSFVLCHLNEIDVPESFWSKLRAMIDYERACRRPDGRWPLIGDADGSRMLPLVPHAADDHEYLLALGAAVFHEAHFKNSKASETPELLWILGEKGLRDYETLPVSGPPQSQAFADAGTYVLRDRDLYLLFNASGSGMNGRGSHGHNDALAIEVSACGAAFIVDPGSYVYTADLKERQRFRSTAYHSTVQVDEQEQNTTDEREPFVIGDEAHPRGLRWEFSDEADVVGAEHSGYAPVKHQRVVHFDKRKRFWKIIDLLHGDGEHNFRFTFAIASQVEPALRADGVVQLRDKISGAQLFLALLDREERPEFVARWISNDYGARTETVAAVWSVQARTPLVVRWALVPACKNDHEATQLELIDHLRGSKGQIRFGII